MNSILHTQKWFDVRILYLGDDLYWPHRRRVLDVGLLANVLTIIVYRFNNSIWISFMKPRFRSTKMDEHDRSWDRFGYSEKNHIQMDLYEEIN